MLGFYIIGVAVGGFFIVGIMKAIVDILLGTAETIGAFAPSRMDEDGLLSPKERRRLGLQPEDPALRAAARRFRR